MGDINYAGAVMELFINLSFVLLLLSSCSLFPAISVTCVTAEIRNEMSNLSILHLNEKSESVLYSMLEVTNRTLACMQVDRGNNLVQEVALYKLDLYERDGSIYILNDLIFRKEDGNSVFVFYKLKTMII